jgi:hypothetical protein
MAESWLSTAWPWLLLIVIAVAFAWVVSHED